MVKQLIYDSRMIVKKETIISACYDIQSSHKKHDGMIVVFQIFLLLAYVCLLIYIHDSSLSALNFPYLSGVYTIDNFRIKGF